jgi:hypothetical protein
MHQTTLTKQSISNSPPFDPTSPVNSEYEVRLYDYFGRSTLQLTCQDNALKLVNTQ